MAESLVRPKLLAVLAIVGLTMSMGLAPLSLRASPSPAPRGLPDVTITVGDILAAGFTRPVQVTHAGDGSGRMFVVEQTGRIKIIQNGQVLATPFLNLASLVACCGERGLLGLAFHPDYQHNGFLYVNYTRSGDGATVIARYSVSADPNLASPGSALILLTIPQPYSNHNGGQVMFGPDGYLYIGMGDGGSGGDPLNHAQNKNTLLGAMLRLDVDSGTPYAIPPDNPYVGRDGADEIWAIGLRNPWRFSFDRASGDLYIGDVGQNTWEEISYQAAHTPGGLNFGWRCREGSHPYTSAPPCDSSAYLAGLTDPIAEYSHAEGQSVTGGFVYRGSLYPALVGRYFFADYVTGKIWSIYQTGSNPTSWSARELELDAPFSISAFGEDEAGELYVVGYSDGTVRRLADVNGPSPVLSGSTKTASAVYADPGQVVTYTLLLRNSGAPSAQTFALTDTLPAGLAYVPQSLTASQGSVDDLYSPVLRWQGALTGSQHITITYWVTTTGAVTGGLVNLARLTGAGLAPITLSHALFVPVPALTTTLQDFFLPGTQPGGLSASIPAPVDCDTCHTDAIYAAWRGSMMGQAGRDPLLWAALAVANHDAPGAGDFCLRCHTPKGWLEGRSHPADGSALSPEDVDASVACEVCHRMVSPIPSASDEAASIDAGIRAALTSTLPADHAGSAMAIVDPQDRRRGPFALGSTFLYHTAYRTDFLGQSAPPVVESSLCGTCHNVDNPLLSWDQERNQFWPNGADMAAPSFGSGQLFPIETTFDEWLNSDFASTGVYAPQFAGASPDGMVASCQDCHMRRGVGKAADNAFNPFELDCLTSGCLPEHDFTGANTWVPQILQDPLWRLRSPTGQAADLQASILRARELLRQAATLTVTLSLSGTDRVADVRVANQTGHKLPTGYPEGRRMWINLRAYDAQDELVYESGAYDPATGSLIEDPAIKVYEARQGITPELAALVEQPEGASFHFVLNNSVVKDNRIPPRGYTQAAFDQHGLRPVGAVYLDGQYWDDTLYVLPLQAERAVVRLYYQTASREYIEFLRAHGGVDGYALASMWEASKSPPELVAAAAVPGYITYLPLVLKGR